MNLFFTRRYTYQIYGSIQNFREDVARITEKPWYDFSENITGKFNSDDEFTFTHKWSLAIIKWIESSPAYLKGRLEEKEGKSVIYVTVRPNSLFVIFFYLLIILFFSELFGINRYIQDLSIVKLLFFPFFIFILIGLIFFYTNGLQKRFERIMNIEHYDRPYPKP